MEINDYDDENIYQINFKNNYTNDDDYFISEIRKFLLESIETFQNEFCIESEEKNNSKENKEFLLENNQINEQMLEETINKENITTKHEEKVH